MLQPFKDSSDASLCRCCRCVLATSLSCSSCKDYAAEEYLNVVWVMLKSITSSDGVANGVVQSTSM